MILSAIWADEKRLVVDDALPIESEPGPFARLRWPILADSNRPPEWTHASAARSGASQAWFEMAIDSAVPTAPRAAHRESTSIEEPTPP